MGYKPIELKLDLDIPTTGGIVKVVVTIGPTVIEKKVALVGDEDLQNVIELSAIALKDELPQYDIKGTEDSIIFTPIEEGASKFITASLILENTYGSEWDILSEGFEDVVRDLIGEEEGMLPDSLIDSRAIAGMAEITVKKRVPEWREIMNCQSDDEEEQLICEENRYILEAATIYYMCYLVSPGMAHRTRFKVKTIELSWEKLRTNWMERAEEFKDLFEEMLSMLGGELIGVPRIFDISKVVRRDD